MEVSNMPLGGHWVLVILMIILATWVIYRYLAPQNFKEWRNAGLIQGFIIALYAEMYGFPLTIYLLTGFLGLEIPWLHMRGHLWSTLLGLGDVGAMIEMIIGLGLVILGLLLLMRGWSQVYQAQKDNRLVTDGLYTYVRHPQYTGIFLILFGQLVHWPTILTLLLFPVIVIAYIYLARQEERAMRKAFGQQYIEYMKHTRMFFPEVKNWKLLFKKG